MNRPAPLTIAVVAAALALLLSSFWTAAPAAAIDLGLGSAVAARYNLEFVAENGSRITGTGEIIVRVAADVGLGEDLNAELDVAADASFNLKELASDRRYSVVVSGLTAAGADLTQVCTIEAGAGGRAGCNATFAALASVNAVTVHENGPDGQLVARARVSTSVGIDLGLGL